MDILIKHQQDLTFLLLGDSNLTIRISDAPTIWSINRDILFHTGYRIAGLKSSMESFLIKLGIDQNSIKNILNTSLTYLNHNSTFLDVFIQEQNSYYNIISNQFPQKPKFDHIYQNIDLFDFTTYKEDFELLSKYYSHLELYLRTAIWIAYKYSRLQTDDERSELMRDLAYTKMYSNTINGDVEITLIERPNIREWLNMMTNSFEKEQLVYSFYKHFEPNNYEQKAENLYAKYQDRLETLFNKAYKRYVNRNHRDQNLWF